ncbi:MAG: recombinase family protein [Candidatus Dadabacteria bacterium]|nr:recombinase family protein [Candidatus Dadabacteria bacterium]
MNIGYARVSTGEQNLDLQVDALENAECKHIFKEVMSGKTLAPLFFEDSTRTSTSFKMAMHQLGGEVLDFDPGASSLKKGETLTDTIRMFEGYLLDIVVIRHNKDGVAQLAADLLTSPLINAGDGQNQHPTQTMLDLFSIKELAGEIDS